MPELRDADPIPLVVAAYFHKLLPSSLQWQRPPHKTQSWGGV